jgi:predicted nucleotidyltransferase
VAGEILLRRQEGNRVYFQANRDCPIYPELVGLLSKTAGLAEALRGFLGPLADQIRVAFVHGSIARSEDHATSDIDLIVVGDLGLAQVAPALRSAEDQLGRAVNATVYTPAEFAAKLAANNHFLTSVLHRERFFLIGDEHVLEELAGGQSSAASRDDPRGAR